MKVKRRSTICGLLSSITLQYRELIQVGVGQFIKSSLLDMCSFLWSVLVGDNVRQTEVLTGLWASIENTNLGSNLVYLDYLLLIVILGHGDSAIKEREEHLWERRKNLPASFAAAKCTFFFFLLDTSDEMQHENHQTAKRITKCVPKHITKRSQRFSGVCYYQT